jgi:hypothetical protein
LFLFMQSGSWCCEFQGYDDIPKEVADPDAKKVY